MGRTFASSLLLLFLGVVSANADPIDVTLESSLKLQQGGVVRFGFSIASYAANNPGYSPDPTSFTFQATGIAPADDFTSTIPHSSEQYLPDLKLEADLISGDGSTVIPLTDNLAGDVGLSAGSLLLTPGTYSGLAKPVVFATGSVWLTPQQSALVFGSHSSSSWGTAYIQIRNEGAPFQLGLDNRTTMRSAFSIANVSGSGPVTTGGTGRSVTYQAPITTPEPGTFVLLFGCAVTGAFFTFGRRILRRRAAEIR